MVRRTARRAYTSSPTRRRRRRRRNPSFDFKGAGIAALGGASLAGAAYAIQETPQIDPKFRGWILLLGGIGAGVLASGWNKALGAGIVGAGAALGGKQLLNDFMTKKAAAPATAGFGAVRAQLGQLGYMPQAGQLGAVQANLAGAYEADLSAVEAELY
jgi:hypothetical protein